MAPWSAGRVSSRATPISPPSQGCLSSPLELEDADINHSLSSVAGLALVVPELQSPAQMTIRVSFDANWTFARFAYCRATGTIRLSRSDRSAQKPIRWPAMESSMLVVPREGFPPRR